MDQSDEELGTDNEIVISTRVDSDGGNSASRSTSDTTGLSTACALRSCLTAKK